MTPSESSSFADALRSRRLPLIAGALLVLLSFFTWRGSFSGPFILDDLGGIVANSTIRSFSEFDQVLSPPRDAVTGGRPVLNLTYAINYFIDRLNVDGYHAFNFAIHVAAALVLFGLVHRTLRLVSAEKSWRDDAYWLAFAAAVLWALHPVQTAAVTYISQRAESLAGLFYLFTLYAFVRAVELPSAPAASDTLVDTEADTKPTRWGRDQAGLRWSLFAVAACFLGMGTSETMVTAPLLVLLYDRTFVAGSFLGALRARPRLYTGLALTWIFLAVMLAGTNVYSPGAGQELTRWSYLLTQTEAFWHYLAISLWPEPLVFAPQVEPTSGLAAVLLGLPLLLALAGTVFALMRWPRVGFLAAWFFIILVPTALFASTAGSPIADHRLYLPLAALVTGIVLLGYSGLGRRVVAMLLVIALAAGFLTAARNRVYRTTLTLWADTVAKQPRNIAARLNLADVFSRLGRPGDAVVQLNAVLKLDPKNASAHNNLANALVALGRVDQAIVHYRAALHLQPEASLVRANFGYILLQSGRVEEAEVQERLAVKQNPYNAAAHLNLALVLQARGRWDDEIASLTNALRLNPDYFEAHFNLGLALLRAGRPADAIPRFETAIALRPAMIAGHLSLIRALLLAGRTADARARAALLVQQAPDSAEAYFLLGNAVAVLGDLPTAIAAYERALSLNANYPEARDNLERVRSALKARQ